MFMSTLLIFIIWHHICEIYMTEIYLIYDSYKDLNT